MAISTDRSMNLNGIDRLKCLFPNSSKTPDTTERELIHTDPCKLAITTPASTVPARLKAAWILTLQCFIVADVFCFNFDGYADNKDTSENRGLTALYVTRLHRSESVKSFISRFEQRQRTSVSENIPESCEIKVVESGSSYHQCNTVLHYRTEARNENLHQEVRKPITFCPSYANIIGDGFGTHSDEVLGI